MHVARAGYYGGDPGAVLAARCDIVCSLIEYIQFTREYEAVEYELNRPQR